MAFVLDELVVAVGFYELPENERSCREPSDRSPVLASQYSS